MITQDPWKLKNVIKTQYIVQICPAAITLKINHNNERADVDKKLIKFTK